MGLEHELMQFFTYNHLPEPQRQVSMTFHHLADVVVHADDLEMEELVPPLIELQCDLVERLPQQNVETRWALDKMSTARELLRGSSIVPRQERLSSVLRLLLEAKDCAVRSTFYKEPE